MPSSSSAWKSCVATGPRSPSKCNASCTSACSPIRPSTCISPTSCAACAAASWTMRSSIARTCARTPTSTRPRRRRTWRRRASRRSPPAGSISYVITTAGPEPVDNVEHPLDREHYVVKQVRPVAEPVLETLGLDFEQVIGDSPAVRHVLAVRRALSAQRDQTTRLAARCCPLQLKIELRVQATAERGERLAHAVGVGGRLQPRVLAIDVERDAASATSPDSATNSRIARRRSAGTLQVAPSGPNQESARPSNTMDDAWHSGTAFRRSLPQVGRTDSPRTPCVTSRHRGERRIEERRAQPALGVEQEDLRVVLDGVFARASAPAPCRTRRRICAAMSCTRAGAPVRPMKFADSG